MRRRSRDAFLEAAGIGQNWRIQFRDVLDDYGKKNLTVRIESVSSDGFSCVMPDGASKFFQWDDMFFAVSEANPPDLMDKQTPCMEWYREKKHLLSMTRISLVSVFRSAFNKMAADPLCPHSPRNLYGVLNASRTLELRNQFFINEQELLERLDSLHRLSTWLDSGYREQMAATALVRLVGKEYVAALNDLIEQAVSNNMDAVLPLACLFYDIKDKTSCFYWLQKHFSSVIHNNLWNDALVWGEKDRFVWWNYLRLSVAFNYYPEVREQLLTLMDMDCQDFALKSMAFLFCERRERYNAEIAYDLASEHSKSVTRDTLESLFSMLDDSVTLKDWDSYFYRYCRLASHILDDSMSLYCRYDSNTDLEGFIYDYVDSRNYSLILGYDMIPYFLYFDDETQVGDATSKEILRKVEREMNVLTPLSDETPVRLVFDRVSDINQIKRQFLSVRNAKLA